MKPHILVIDDEQEFLTCAQDLLIGWEYEIDTAQTGYEALQRISLYQYDLILLDVCMPKYSGINFIHDLKAKRPSEIKKVIIVSLLELRESHKNEFLKLGIHSVEEKPSTIQRLEIIQKNILLK